MVARMPRGVVGAGCLILLAWRAAPAQEHLEPPVGVMFLASTSYDYCKNVDALFFAKSPRGYPARMFCRPGFNRPQWCVTVYRETADAPATVEFVAAAAPIDGRPESLRIRVTRAIQPIDAETARLVEVAWRRMLRGARYPDKQEEGGDGDEFDFARSVLGVGGFDLRPGDPPYGSEAGMTHEPAEGTRAARLVRIGSDLKRFALAATIEERTALRDAIRRQARELDVELTRPRAPE